MLRFPTNLKMSRWPMCLLSAWTTLLSSWLSQGNFQIKFPVIMVAIGMAILIAGTIINNDIADQKIDQRKGKSIKKLPFTYGLEVIFLGTFLIHLALPLNFLTPIQKIGYYAILWIAFYGLIAHSLIKSKFTFLPPLIVAVWSTSPVFVGAYTAGKITLLHWTLAVIIFFVIISREVIKDIEDIKYDCGFRPTIPIKIGIQNAILISIVMIIIATSFVICIIWIKLATIFTSVSLVAIFVGIIAIFRLITTKDKIKIAGFSSNLLAIFLWMELIACHFLVT